VSIVFHAAFGVGLVIWAARPSHTKQIVKFSVVKHETPPPKQEIKVEPPPPPKPPPRPKITKPIDLTKPQPKAPPPSDKPFDANKPVNNNPPAPVPDFGVNPSLTSDQGSFAVRTGGTAMADPEKVKNAKKGEGTGGTGEFNPVPVARVTKMPELIADHKVDYPEEARKQGIEGKVVLQIDIDENGKVVKARVVKGAGYGLDEAAVAAAYKFQFKPAFSEGLPVPVRILYTYSFILEE
jgi:protein TonB